MNANRLLPPLALAVALAVAAPSAGFIDLNRPTTLGELCARAQSVTVMTVDKLSKEKGVLVLKKVKDLKGELPRGEVRDALGAAHEPAEKKHCLGAVEVGQSAVVFRYENRLVIGLGDCWHVCDTPAPEDKGEPLGGNTRTEPAFLQSYCGPAKALPELAAAVLDGKEVVVPVMLGKRDKELRTRTGEVVRVRASLKLLDFDPKRDAVAEPKK